MTENELYHHGILGMKWGVRRYQNADGTLTAAGKKRYYKSDGNLTKKGERFKQRIIETSEKNTDLVDQYHINRNNAIDKDKNEHLKKLNDQVNRTSADWENAEYNFENALKFGTKKDLQAAVKELDEATEKTNDAWNLFDSARKRHNDAVYEEFKKEMSAKTLADLGFENTIRGRKFIEDVIGDYYKLELD